MSPQGLFLFTRVIAMRYHYEKPQKSSSIFGRTYVCDHPAYSRCTLYLIGEKGLAVIQQRFDGELKHTWWSEIDPWLRDDLYLHPAFEAYFDERSGARAKDLYPTVTIRQIMWALKMKPLPKERWETVFDRKGI